MVWAGESISLSLILPLSFWHKDHCLFVYQWQFASGTGEWQCVLVSERHHHLGGSLLLKELRLWPKWAGSEGVQPGDGSKALLRRPLASLLKVLAKLLGYGSAGFSTGPFSWEYLCALVLARMNIRITVLHNSRVGGVCRCLVGIGVLTWGFICVCMHVFCFCFNFCVALHLSKKRAQSQKWGGKQRFAKDL